MQLGGGDCYDPHEGSFFTSRGREAITHNRFSKLFDFVDEVEEILQPKNTPDFSVGSASSQERRKKHKEDDYFSSFAEFISKNHKNFSLNMFFIDDSNSYMYTNKNFWYSGYFPDFITIPPVVNMFDNKNVSSNFYSYNTLKQKCFDDNDSFCNLNYQPRFLNGKYRRQVSNLYSKYNSKYFFKLHSSYKISKKFWGLCPVTNNNFLFGSKYSPKTLSSKHPINFKKINKYNFSYKDTNNNNNKKNDMIIKNKSLSDTKVNH